MYQYTFRPEMYVCLWIVEMDGDDQQWEIFYYFHLNVLFFSFPFYFAMKRVFFVFLQFLLLLFTLLLHASSSPYITLYAIRFLGDMLAVTVVYVILSLSIRMVSLFFVLFLIHACYACIGVYTMLEKRKINIFIEKNDENKVHGSFDMCVCGWFSTLKLVKT